VELEIQTKLKENHIVDINEKLKLLEIITNGYREIQRLDNVCLKKNSTGKITLNCVSWHIISPRFFVSLCLIFEFPYIH